MPVLEALAQRFPAHEIVVYSDEFMNHLHVTFMLAEGRLTWTHDACQCFGEDDTSLHEMPLTKAEIDYFGIEQAS